MLQNRLSLHSKAYFQACPSCTGIQNHNASKGKEAFEVALLFIFKRTILYCFKQWEVKKA